MTNLDFVKLVANYSGCTQTAVKEVLAGLPDAIRDVCLAQDDVVLGKAVRISGVWKESHEARNPMTGDTITVPAKTVVKVKVMPTFKQTIAGGGSTNE